ncbi:hypothetical protein ABZY57_04430 [Streptomyces sp. NPDC006450]|uniref:hypothetical protein n=1 Tax=Streptomyces sp. NPDC006450 TaxID=3155458 RepID=UPI0033BDA858
MLEDDQEHGRHPGAPPDAAGAAATLCSAASRRCPVLVSSTLVQDRVPLTSRPAFSSWASWNATDDVLDNPAITPISGSWAPGRAP